MKYLNLIAIVVLLSAEYSLLKQLNLTNEFIYQLFGVSIALVVNAYVFGTINESEKHKK